MKTESDFTEYSEVFCREQQIVPVIVIGKVNQNEKMVEAMEKGAVYFLFAPLNVDYIVYFQEFILEENFADAEIIIKNNSNQE